MVILQGEASDSNTVRTSIWKVCLYSLGEDNRIILAYIKYVQNIQSPPEGNYKYFQLITSIFLVGLKIKQNKVSFFLFHVT